MRPCYLWCLLALVACDECVCVCVFWPCCSNYIDVFLPTGGFPGRRGGFPRNTSISTVSAIQVMKYVIQGATIFSREAFTTAELVMSAPSTAFVAPTHVLAGRHRHSRDDDRAVLHGRQTCGMSWRAAMFVSCCSSGSSEGELVDMAWRFQVNR